jgi:hypothetical protein
MKLFRSDLPHIQTSLIVFALSLTIGAGAVWLSDSFINQTLLSRQAAQKQLNDARNKLSTAEIDQENMGAYANEYEALEKRQIIGNEQRLDWIENLETLRKREYVLDYQYNIAPQQAYTPSPPLDAGNFNIMRSNMSLQFDLLHEEQLLHFFTALNTEFKGKFMLDHCSIERATSTKSEAQLNSECTGGWLSIKNKATP